MGNTSARGAVSQATTAPARGDGVAGRDSALTRRALYYTPPNSFAFALPEVACHRFVAERDAALRQRGRTGLVPLDLSQALATAYPATTPMLLMRYATLAAGDSLRTAFAASAEVCYVLEGRGRTVSDGVTIEWEQGDLLVLPGGAETMHAAGEGDALLYLATNEPQLAFESLRPAAPGTAAIEAVHYPAQEIRRQLDRLCRERGQEDIAGKAVLFTSGAMRQTRTCFPTVSVGLNIFEPGDEQLAHRHNAVAVTLCLRARPGAHSIIDGRRIDWEDNLVLLTPPTAAHAHYNHSDAPMLALVIQDSGLYYYTRAVGFGFA